MSDNVYYDPYGEPPDTPGDAIRVIASLRQEITRLKESFNPLKYWIEVDFNKMPTGKVCFATYPGDKPAVGHWLECVWTGNAIDNEGRSENGQ